MIPTKEQLDLLKSNKDKAYKAYVSATENLNTIYADESYSDAVKESAYNEYDIALGDYIDAVYAYKNAIDYNKE